MRPDVTSLFRSATSESVSDGCLQMSTSMLPNALISSSGNALQTTSIGSSASRQGGLAQPSERFYPFSRFSRDSGAAGVDAASKSEESKPMSIQSLEPYNKPTSARNRIHQPVEAPAAADPPPSGSPSALFPRHQKSPFQQDDRPEGGRSLRRYPSSGLHRAIIQKQQQQPQQYAEQEQMQVQQQQHQSQAAAALGCHRLLSGQQQQHHVSWRLHGGMPLGQEDGTQPLPPPSPLSLPQQHPQQEQRPAAGAAALHERLHSGRVLVLLPSPLSALQSPTDAREPRPASGRTGGGARGALVAGAPPPHSGEDRTDTWDALVRDDPWVASLLHPHPVGAATSTKQDAQALDAAGSSTPLSPTSTAGHPTQPNPQQHPHIHAHPHPHPAPRNASSDLLSASSPEPPFTTPHLNRGRGTLRARHSSQVLLPPLVIRSPGGGGGDGLDGSPCFFGPDALPGLLGGQSPRNSDCGIGVVVVGGGGNGRRNSSLAAQGGSGLMVAHVVRVAGGDRHQQYGMVANAAVVLPIDSSSMSLLGASSQQLPSASTSVNTCIAGGGVPYGDLMPSGVAALERTTSYHRAMLGHCMPDTLVCQAPCVGRHLAAGAPADAYNEPTPAQGAGAWMVWAGPAEAQPDVGDISLRRRPNAPPPPPLPHSAGGAAAAAPDEELLLQTARGSVSQATVFPFLSSHQISGPVPLADSELGNEPAETLPVADVSVVAYDDAAVRGLTVMGDLIGAIDGGGGPADIAAAHRGGGSAGSGCRTPDVSAAAPGGRALSATHSNASTSRGSAAVSACASRCTPSTARTSTTTACRITPDSAASNLPYGFARASPVTRVASPSEVLRGDAAIAASFSTAVSQPAGGVAPSADGHRHSYVDTGPPALAASAYKGASRDGALDASCSSAETPLCRWKRAARSAGLAASIARGFRTLRYQHEENLVKDEQLKVISEIGSGTFARVDKCMYSPTDGGKPFLVAVKRIRSEMLLAGHDPEDLQLFIQEAQLLRKLNHPNIVQYIGLGIQLPEEPPDGATPNLEHISLQLAQPPPTYSLPDEPRRPGGGGRAPRRASVGATATPPPPPPVRGMFIVEEFMASGTLKSAVYKQMLQPQHQIYSNATALRWMAQVAVALSYMHTCRPKVLHRDIKLDNVLLRREGGRDAPSPSALDDCSAKLGDLGLAALLAYHRRGTGGGGGEAELMETLDCMGVDLAALRKNSDVSCAVRKRVTAAGQVAPHLHLREANDPERLSRMLASHRRERLGTYMYMAPEVYRRQKYDEKCDCFSFAIVLYEVFHRFIVACSLEDPTQMERYARQVSHGFRPTIHEDLPAPLRRVIRQCWAQDPDDRPSMAVVAAELWGLQSRGVVAALDRKQQSGVWRGCGSLSPCCVVS